jgi:2,4-dienoyl-CoA reductase (NADPH2)
MAKALSGSEKYPNLFQPRQIGQFLAPNSVKYAACSVSNFNKRDGSTTEREHGRMETMRVYISNSIWWGKQ